MEETKRNRVAAAVTVNIVILIAVLVAVIIYQLVYITILTGRRNAMKDEIKKYEQMLEESEDDLQYLQSEQNLRDLAFKYGYYYPND